MLHFILSVLPTVLAVAADDCADCVRAPSLLQRSGQALAAVQLGSDATACTTSATHNCEPIHEITQHILSQPASSQLSMLRKYSEPLLAQLDISNRSNHTAIIKNGTADLHGLITGLLDELHSTLKGYQVSLNASVDAFHACADLLHIDQGLVTTQANAMGQTAQLQSELNSSVKVVGDFGSTAETAAAAATALKAEVDSKAFAFTSKLASIEAEYDGDTWWYHDAGVKYYDECVYLASSAGATIIDPVTIGMGDSIDYWTFTKHSGNVYTYYTGIDTIAHHNVGCQSRGDAHKCMFGFMEV